MQEKGFFTQRKAAVVMCIVLFMWAQQVCAGPLPPQLQSSADQTAVGERTMQTLRRVARMTPLWRIMSSKPSGAFCQNNFECATGLCRAGHCSKNQGSSSEPPKS